MFSHVMSVRGLAILVALLGVAEVSGLDVRHGEPPRAPTLWELAEESSAIVHVRVKGGAVAAHHRRTDGGPTPALQEVVVLSTLKGPVPEGLTQIGNLSEPLFHMGGPLGEGAECIVFLKQHERWKHGDWRGFMPTRRGVAVKGGTAELSLKYKQIIEQMPALISKGDVGRGEARFRTVLLQLVEDKHADVRWEGALGLLALERANQDQPDGPPSILAQDEWMRLMQIVAGLPDLEPEESSVAAMMSWRQCEPLLRLVTLHATGNEAAGSEVFEQCYVSASRFEPRSERQRIISEFVEKLREVP